MPILESQLETWAGQGSVTQSAATYATIRRALMEPSAKYRDRNFEVFLQGSYGNDTNIYAESDVDVVIRYDGAFFHDLSELPPKEQKAFADEIPEGTYLYADFKADVEKALQAAFGRSVKPGNKVFTIAPNGSRRSADVVVTFEFRRYFKFNGEQDQNYEPGICFFRGDGVRIANYPKQHSENCTAKHQATNGNFKPMVRIFKNLRGALIEEGLIGEGTAPSYFIEGLLYNVPDALFTGSYEEMLYNCLDWLHKQPAVIRDKWLCVNEQYFLLRDDPVCWSPTHCVQFIDAAIKYWNR
ncbi:MAG TPA: nucleotidyltransferase [Opitutaceae bacterium]|nr:nucleotidyltransferase [Opitutaceae bacterium]HRJ47382.1 nucleotidyltransferase [Opitutaceae bacterium]